jgi:hypothetical protein
LDELDSGVCDGLTYKDIAKEYPEDFAARDQDKYNYRYLGGESYRDVVIRLEPIIMELERSENILIVTHQAILRCIYAYFMNVEQERSPWMEVPLHTLIKLTPRAYATEEERLRANVPAVSTWRAQGSLPVHSDSPGSTPAVENDVFNLPIRNKEAPVQSPTEIADPGVVAASEMNGSAPATNGI